MSLKQLVLGSYQCTLGHKHSNEADMVQCNKMEQKKREMEFKREEDIRRLENEQKRRQHEIQVLEMNLELERIKQENLRNEKNERTKSKVCSVM